MSEHLDALLAGIREVFGVRAWFGSGPERGRRLALPGLPPLCVDTEDTATLARVQRFVQRELGLHEELRLAHERLNELKTKTRNLLPGDADSDAELRSWSALTMDMGLLRSFDEWAVLVDGELVQRSELALADVESTMRVLDEHGQRSVPVDDGELFGLCVGSCAVVVRDGRPLDPTDRELVALQAHFVHRLHVEREHLERLEALRIEAEAGARAKATFLAHMSHELRTPLNGVIGAAQLLDETELDAEQRELVRLQLQSGDWLREVVDAVLDLSKVEEGSMRLERIPFQPRELVRAVAAGVRPLLDGKGLALDTHVAEEVPEWVLGDPTRIRQALLNLLSNAIKFTAQGGVRVRVLPEGELFAFAVEDDGIGIDAAQSERIFEPFRQADSSTTRCFGGTGLGLSLVREFARLHGGDARAQGRPGAGSTFTFTAHLPSAAAPDPDSKDPVDPSRPEARPLDVLVAEDNPTNQLILRRMLAKRGHRVTLCGNGREAVAEVRRRRFDLVLMDQMMPFLNGNDATREIRALGEPAASTPIVSITAAVTPEDLAAYEDAGYHGFLPKPIDLGELVRLLGVVANRSNRAA
ncbi:MAG: ATP-binding protein [Planctomycetota bacterium]